MVGDEAMEDVMELDFLFDSGVDNGFADLPDRFKQSNSSGVSIRLGDEGEKGPLEMLGKLASAEDVLYEFAKLIPSAGVWVRVLPISPVPRRIGHAVEFLKILSLETRGTGGSVVLQAEHRS